VRDRDAPLLHQAHPGPFEHLGHKNPLMRCGEVLK
jgi:hypothetical protein